MRIWIYTLGCRLNQCESEAIAEAFADEGFEVLSSYDEADICIVNTCTVTSKAEQKARRMIRLYCQNPATKAVIVTGCYAQMDKEGISGLGGNVIALGGLVKSRLLELPSYLAARPGLDLLEACRLFCMESGDSTVVRNPFSFDPSRFTFHSRAYLKVQDGCDNNCFYCRVRLARGPSVSLPKEEAVRRALELEKAGYHEIVLTGVNLTMYNHDTDGLGGLLGALLEALGPDVRLRFSSLEPDHIDEDFLTLIKDRRVQPHFHIPLQSGSDAVLRRVNRRYSVSHVADTVERMRNQRPDAFIACDVIAGLPSEGEAEFEETYRFLQDCRFAQLHVFPFSPRPGTQLYKSVDRPPESVRDERAGRLRELSSQLHGEYLRSQSGKEAEAILESRRGKLWTALTGNYIEVLVDDGSGLHRGQLVNVRFPSMDGRQPEIRVRRF